PSKYWPAACEAIGQPELARDERFAEPAALLRNGAAAAQILAAAFAERTAAEWRERLARFPGQWALVQDTLEVADDPQTVANGYIAECRSANGAPFRLATAPVQYD